MVEINNLTNYDLPLEELKNLAEKVLSKNKSDLSVAFLGSKKISEYNHIYRKKKRATDVLSFKDGDFLLGEVLICPSFVEKQAKENNLFFEQEIKRVLIHGILHLLGYNHKEKEEEKEMKEKEEFFLIS